MGLLKHVFFTTMTFFGCNVLNVNPLKYVSINNQKWKIRLQIININSNEPSFYPYSIEKIHVVVVAITLMIHMQNYVFMILLKT